LEPFAKEYRGHNWGHSTDGRGIAETLIVGSQEWRDEDSLTSRMSIRDADGKPDMRVSLRDCDGHSSLVISNGSGDLGKAAVEIPLSTSFQGVELPSCVVGEVELLQSRTHTRMALYPVAAEGQANPTGAVVYRNENGTLFME
jgi:hypothetical protein